MAETQSRHYYTTSTAVGALLGTTFDGDSTPTYESVATFVAAASAEIEAITERIWSTGSVTDEFHDTLHRDPAGAFYVKNTPILTVATFEINEGSALAQSWAAKVEDEDYLVYPDRVEYFGTLKGWRGLPRVNAYGARRYRIARISYTYGVATTPADIAQAAAYKAASLALLAQRNNATANGPVVFQVGQTKSKCADTSRLIASLVSGC